MKFIDTTGDSVIGACWAITTDCNMKCPFCFSFEEKGAASLDTKKRIIDILAEYGLRKISFGGGEPLLDTDIASLIRYANVKGLRTALCTNGVLLNEAILREIEGSLTELSLPLEGSNSAIHEMHRPSCEHFRAVIGLLKEVREYDISVDISTVATRRNIGDLPSMTRIISDNGITKWKVFQFFPLGRGYQNRQEFEISEREFIMAKEVIADSARGLDIDFGSANDARLKSYLNISPCGNIFMVWDHTYQVIGNILSGDALDPILKEAGFNYAVHKRRHWRDIGEEYDKQEAIIDYY